MPYLEKKNRQEMDAGVQPRTAGELTYCLTKIIQWYLSAGPLSYERLASVMGAIEGCKADFIERLLRPYETLKCEENGDVWED